MRKLGNMTPNNKINSTGLRQANDVLSLSPLNDSISLSLPVSPAGCVFMCRLCNLFSPSRHQLLAHCSTLHPEKEPPDEIIIALQPLVGGPAETLAGHISVSLPRLLAVIKS